LWGGGKLLERSFPPPHTPLPFKNFPRNKIREAKCYFLREIKREGRAVRE